MKLGLNDPSALYGQVYLDGVLQDACVYADDEAGCIERYKRDAHGKFIVLRHGRLDAYVERETVYGRVEIVLRAPIPESTP